VTVVALASAKGSPGVTTLAHRLGDVLARRERQSRRPPRPVVLVEADPSGGDLAGRRGLAGAPGLASLALSARRALTPETVFEHCQQLGAIGVLAGVAGYRQGLVVAPVLPRVLDALAEADALVLLDLGRIGPPAVEDPELLRRAGSVCLVSRTSAESVVHVRSAVDALRAQSVASALVLVGKSDYPVETIAAAVGAPVLATIADSPAEAATDPRWPLRGRRGDLARSIDVFADTLTDTLTDAATHALAAPSGPHPAEHLTDLPSQTRGAGTTEEAGPTVVELRGFERGRAEAGATGSASPASSA
jgi:MinD-like ATPase involved in chromosome partitioning or flagellar assembly